MPFKIKVFTINAKLYNKGAKKLKIIMLDVLSFDKTF